MRWKLAPKPKDKSERIVSRFLWVPTTLRGERRWLERARIRQRYDGFPENWLELSYPARLSALICTRYAWDDVEFVDEVAQ